MASGNSSWFGSRVQQKSRGCTTNYCSEWCTWCTCCFFSANLMSLWVSNWTPFWVDWNLTVMILILPLQALIFRTTPLAKSEDIATAKNRFDLVWPRGKKNTFLQLKHQFRADDDSIWITTFHCKLQTTLGAIVVLSYGFTMFDSSAWTSSILIGYNLVKAGSFARSFQVAASPASQPTTNLTLLG